MKTNARKNTGKTTWYVMRDDRWSPDAVVYRRMSRRIALRETAVFLDEAWSKYPTDSPKTYNQIRHELADDFISALTEIEPGESW